MDEVTTDAGRGRRLHVAPVVVLVVALAVTGLAAGLTKRSHDDTEDKLLDQRVEAASTVFMGSLPGLASPLVGGATLAEETDGDMEAVRGFLEPQVGEEAQFDSLSVWPLGAEDPEPLLVVGGDPQLADDPPVEIAEYLNRTVSSPDLAVLDLVSREVPSIGFAAGATRSDPRYVVYAENVLPPNRTNLEQEEAPFEDLDYALYIGEEETDEQLLVSSRPDVPLEGRTGRTLVPFGDTDLLLVLRPQGDLAGELSGRLPWIILLAGGLLSLLFAVLLERLQRRGDAALALADENRRLYDEQRTVADAVQHSLLPGRLPDVPGVEIEVRYRPGVQGTEVGGDWYDVVELADDRVLVVVGDVAGRGLRAATVMAMLRHATRAYALEGTDPAEVPTKLTQLLRLDEDGGFATVLLLVLDLTARTVTVVNAGHPRPLLIDGERRFVESPVSPPVGVVGARRSGASAAVAVAPGSTILAFTDGLFERRGESVDDGMERLRATVDPDRPLAEVLDGLLDDLSTGAEPDDVAIVGVRW